MRRLRGENKQKKVAREPAEQAIPERRSLGSEDAVDRLTRAALQAATLQGRGSFEAVHAMALAARKASRKSSMAAPAMRRAAPRDSRIIVSEDGRPRLRKASFSVPDLLDSSGGGKALARPAASVDLIKRRRLERRAQVATELSECYRHQDSNQAREIHAITHVLIRTYSYRRRMDSMEHAKAHLRHQLDYFRDLAEKESKSSAKKAACKAPESGDGDGDGGEGGGTAQSSKSGASASGSASGSGSPRTRSPRSSLVCIPHPHKRLPSPRSSFVVPGSPKLARTPSPPAAASQAAVPPARSSPLRRSSTPRSPLEQSKGSVVSTVSQTLPSSPLIKAKIARRSPRPSSEALELGERPVTAPLSFIAGASAALVAEDHLDLPIRCRPRRVTFSALHADVSVGLDDDHDSNGSSASSHGSSASLPPPATAVKETSSPSPELEAHLSLEPPSQLPASRKEPSSEHHPGPAAFGLMPADAGVSAFEELERLLSPGPDVTDDDVLPSGPSRAAGDPHNGHARKSRLRQHSADASTRDGPVLVAMDEADVSCGLARAGSPMSSGDDDVLPDLPPSQRETPPPSMSYSRTPSNLSTRSLFNAGPPTTRSAATTRGFSRRSFSEPSSPSPNLTNVARAQLRMAAMKRFDSSSTSV